MSAMTMISVKIDSFVQFIRWRHRHHISFEMKAVGVALNEERYQAIVTELLLSKITQLNTTKRYNMHTSIYCKINFFNSFLPTSGPVQCSLYDLISLDYFSWL